MPDAPRYIAYVRQSLNRDGDDSLSMAFQERAIRELIERHDGVIIEPPIRDPDEKGWDPNRPGIADLIERVEREQPDAIAVYAVSRFARDNWLQEGIWRRLKAVNPDMRFESVTEPHAEDDMVRGILGVISQAERKRMGAFLSSSFRERARRGIPHGRVPFGFRKREDGRLAIDPDAADWVRQMVEHAEAGWSLWRIAVWLNDHGVDGRLWEPNTVRNTMTTPAVAGGVKCADVLTWGAHEPIIDRERYDRLAAMLATRRPSRTKDVSSWLEGMLFCSCGAPMYLMTLRQGYATPRGQFKCAAFPAQQPFSNRRFPPCAASPRSIMQHRAEGETITAITNDLGTILDPDDVYRELAQLDISAADDRATARKRLARQLQGAQKERDRLLVLYRRGSLDVERWEAEDSAAATRIDELNQALDRIPDAPDRSRIVADANALGDIRAMLDDVVQDNPAELRTILMGAGATVAMDGKHPRIVWPDRLRALLG